MDFKAGLLQIATLLLWITVHTYAQEFCDSYRNIQRIACAEDKGCVYGVKGSSSWAQAPDVCKCYGTQFADIPEEMQLSINEAPKNLEENLWISGKRRSIQPCGFVRGLTLADQIICDAFRTGVFLWMVQAFYTQGHRGAPATPICRREGCVPNEVRHCIHFGNETDNWYDARNQCLKDGGDLFYLTQADNDNFIEFLKTFFNILQTIPSIGSPVFWSGIRYEDWYWQAAGDVMQTNWGPNEPNTEPDFDCITMNMTTGEWVSMPCKYNFGVMCRDPNATFIANPTLPSTSTQSTASTESTSEATTPTTMTTPTTTVTTSTTTATTTTETTSTTTTTPMPTTTVKVETTSTPKSTTTTQEVTTSGESEKNTTESPNATAVKLSYCIQNKAVCSAVPAVVVIVAVGMLVCVLLVCLRLRKKKAEKPLVVHYPIELPHKVEEDFSGLQDGARAAENIYVENLNGDLKDEEGIYETIGKKGYEDGKMGYDFDDDDDLKKPPFDDDDDDFDSLKKPRDNYAFEYEDDLKKWKS